MAKPRVLISTDAGGADADDIQSLVHAFLYADQFNLEGIVSTPTNHGGRVSNIHKVINAYAQDYEKLKTWSSSYPTPEYLKSITAQGKIDPQPEKGWSAPTAGSKAIIQAAHESGGPLWVLCWGAMTDLAQALHDDPSIVSKIKVYSSNGWNGTQDPHSREYIWNNFKDLWWIESKSTHRGIWVDDKGGGGNDWKMGDADGHGALGEYYQNARPWGLKEGDTPSLLYVLKNASGNPSSGSWGGSFVKTDHGPHFWTDNPSPSLKIGPYNGAKTIQQYQDNIYKEFAGLLDRAKAPKSGASKPANTDDPVTAVDDSASTALGKLVKINVLNNDKAPDGGLKVAVFDATTAKGGKVALTSDGKLTYAPKAGYVGTDKFGYTAKDADGDADRGSVMVKVAAASPNKPNPSHDDEKPSTGSGKPVVAGDDNYTVDAGEALYFNPKYLLMNDKGGDGGLKVSGIDKVSDVGFSVKWNGKDTAIYRPKAEFSGNDRIDYVIKDKDGSADTGTMIIAVGEAHAGKPPAKPGAPQSGSEKNLAIDNVRELKEGDTYYFNSKYLTWNGKGPSRDGKVVDIDDRSAKGVKVTWEKDGTVIYSAKSGSTGIDKIGFTVQDKMGHRDTATVVLKIGNSTEKAQHWPSETMALHASVTNQSSDAPDLAWQPNDHLLT